jgi:hypothetical protein
MKKTFTILIIILGIPAGSLPQKTFEKTFGGPYYDAGNSVLQTQDNGYLIIGTSRYYNPNVNSLYLVKTDIYGDTIWTKVYGGDANTSGTFIQVTSDSGYIVLGATNSYGAGSEDVYLLKINTDGDTLWTKTFGGPGIDYGHCVRQTEDQGYIIAGHTNSYGSGLNDIYLIKTDILGDTLWTKSIGGSDYEWCKNIQQTSDMGYILVGDTKSSGKGDNDVYLIKTDASGDTMWTRTYGGSNYDRGYSLVQTPEGYIIAAGTESFGAGKRDLYIIGTNSAGDTLWTKILGGPEYDNASFIQKTDDGNYIIAGETGSFGDTEIDLFLVKIDPAGNVLWTRTFGGAGYDRGSCVQQTNDGGYIITGSSYSYSVQDDSDIYLVKTDSGGYLTQIADDRWPDRLLDFKLAGNFPNPFREATTFSYQVFQPSRIKLEIFALDGSLLMQIFDKYHLSGEYQVKWHPGNLDDGCYFYRLRSNADEITGKMILTR